MREELKLIKKLFYFIVLLLGLGCAFVLICAFNPDMTSRLSEKIEEFSQGIGNAKEEEYISVGKYDNMPGVNAMWLIGTDADKYTMPSGKPKNPPISVGNKTGYEPVTDDATQILQEEAEAITGIIAPGETGSSLIFDEKFYPYYAMLQQDMRSLYNQIYANANALTVTFTPVVTVSVEQLKNVFAAVYNDHPELFWLETEYSCKYLKSGTCVEITLKYNDTVNYLTEAKERFKAATANIVAAVSTIEGNYQKERYIHDTLLQVVEYDEKAIMGQSAYSALVNGKSVCAGYARAFQYLLQQLGIPSYYCTGYTGENHAWNIVEIDKRYYNVDVTWADSDPVTYDYFNKTDSEVATTHVRTGLSVYLPACVLSNTVAAGPSSDIYDWINPNPIEPLRWKDTPSVDNTGGMTAEEKEKENLDKAGIKKEDVRSTMEEYYSECEKLLREVGKGDKKYTVIVPEALWTKIESAYSKGSHMAGYATEVIEEWGLENFVIQLQVQRLGGGYYKVYHNVLTY